VLEARLRILQGKTAFGGLGGIELCRHGTTEDYGRKLQTFMTFDGLSKTISSHSVYGNKLLRKLHKSEGIFIIIWVRCIHSRLGIFFRMVDVE